MRLERKNKIWTLAMTLASVSTFSACGGYSNYYNPTPTPTYSNIPNPDTGGGTTTTDPDDGMTALSFSFTVTGAGGTMPSFSTKSGGKILTDNMLKVRVNAGAAGQLALTNGYSNFNARYGCVSYRVSLYNYTTGAAIGGTVTTSLLSINGGSWNCAGAPSAQIINFSSRLYAGHPALAVKVEVDKTDFDCQACYSYPYAYNAQIYGCNLYCPSKTVNKNHTVTGSIDVQVNGTSL
jgi:hypothetical protein